ncbi:hypothetical protein ACA30_17925 [Virgibacillus soli]|nr:hypothetical protein ACA30_17925 [Virgibacillus soli]
MFTCLGQSHFNPFPFVKEHLYKFVFTAGKFGKIAAMAKTNNIKTCNKNPILVEEKSMGI